MSNYNERLEADNIKIDEITALANSLPDAGEIHEKLDTQDTIIANLKSALNNKAGGSGSMPNAFSQMDMPEADKGIWIRQATPVEHVLCDDDVYFADTYGNTMTDIPYDFYGGGAAVVDSEIYLFGGVAASPYTQCAKYDKYGVWRTPPYIEEIPYSFYYGSVVAVGTDIYLFGSADNPRYNYKYDTLTNTYTPMSNIPYDFYNGSAVAVGTDIYLFGSEPNKKLAAKYDTLTDTYTQLKNMPYSFYRGVAVNASGRIFIFGGAGGSQIAAEYNIANNTYTQISNIPYKFSNGGAVAIGTDVYLFGGASGDTKTTCYKYDTLTDTYTKMTDIPYGFSLSNAVVAIDNNICLLGSGEAGLYRTRITYHPYTKSYDVDNAMIIQSGDTYKAELITLSNSEEGYQPVCNFDNVYFYTLQDGLDTPMEKYYADEYGHWMRFF